MKPRSVFIIASSVTLLQTGVAAAATIDNPGPFRLTIVSGYVTIGDRVLLFDPDNPPTIEGVMTSSGDGGLRQSIFPDLVVSIPEVGDVAVRFEEVGGSEVILVPSDGFALFAFHFRLWLVHPDLPPDCQIPVFELLASVFAMGGVPYDQQTGTATVGADAFARQTVANCGSYADAIDAFFGPPTDPLLNRALLSVSYDPIFFGS